jgi:hypothetical protein
MDQLGGIDATSNKLGLSDFTIPIRLFSGVAGAAVPFSAPLNAYGGLTTARVALNPQENYGGLTESPITFGPQNGFSGITDGTVFFTGVPPATNLVATPVATGRIALTWIDVSDKETGFRIERSPNGQGAWGVIGSVGTSVTIFLDNNATPLVVFDYRVIAFNPIEDASPSNIASAFSPAPGQPAPPPPAPPLLRRILEFLSPGTYGLERDQDGNVGGNKF